ncbi:S-layer homology domain-containing protein [Leucobacter massiliensis]|nr:S-layer homology domain-containing protein [Leucobacter massiliensis]
MAARTGRLTTAILTLGIIGALLVPATVAHAQEDPRVSQEANADADAGAGGAETGADGAGEEPAETPAPAPSPEPQPEDPSPAPSPESPAPADPEGDAGDEPERTPFDDVRALGAEVDRPGDDEAPLKPLEGVALSELAAQSLAGGFQAGNIISDANFYNGSAMTSAQVQSFLNQQVPRCTIGDPGRIAGGPAIVNGRNVGTVDSNCLKDKRFSSPNRTADQYCGAYSGGSGDSAATVIVKVSRACGISPRVLLVMLQKEQSLVTDTWPTTRQFDFAMGAYCPDTGPGGSANCDAQRKGFANQVYYAAWLMKYYQAHNGLNYNPGRNNTIQWHPNTACGTSQVYISNMATASLYTYTPYRPNQAALNAGFGTGDGCSSYGNRNFFLYYQMWFGSPTTTFPDVPESHKFYKEIEWMYQKGYTTGWKSSDGRVLYRPGSNVTREAMAAFLYRLKGANAPAPSSSPFADVKPGDPFYKEIAWMHQQGLATGYAQGDGKKPRYAPKEPVSREAMAAFIFRFKQPSFAAPSSSPFSDVRKSDKFYREIAWMHAAGLSTGFDQGAGNKPRYAPRESMSREAMAAFIYRLAK